MTDSIDKNRLEQACGRAVSHETFDKIKQYQLLIEKWQKTINLVGSGTLADLWDRHFIDSAQLLPVIENNLSSRCKTGSGANDQQDPGFRRDDKKVLIDLGSGGGFPGLVLAMLMPEWDIHLVESDSRKCAFLKTVSRETATPVTIHEARIEALDPAALPLPDVLTARALAPLEKLLALVQPWAARNPDVLMIFPKGGRAEEEIAAARKIFDFTCEQQDSILTPESRILALRQLVYK